MKTCPNTLNIIKKHRFLRFPFLRIAATAFAIAAFSLAGTQASDGGYLFATFKGESPTGEQIYFALSRDGRTWSALNKSKPVLISEIGTSGVRDPYIIRLEGENKFVLLATDLSIYKKRLETGNGVETWKQAVQSGSRSLVIWESTDLVKWEGPRLVQVAPEDAGCAWAPEAIYDSEAGDYLVFWASTTPATGFKKHRILASRTKDFREFTPAVPFIDESTGVIDTTIVKDGGLYYRFSKNETRKEIVMETSEKLAGPWKEITEFTLRGIPGIEGPECYPLKLQDTNGQKTWCLIADAYAKSLGYQPYTTQSLSSGIFTKAEDFSFPFKFRHGCVLPVSEEEYQRLEKTFGVEIKH